MTVCWSRGEGLVSFAVAAAVYCSAVQIVVEDPQWWERGCVAMARTGMQRGTAVYANKRRRQAPSSFMCEGGQSGVLSAHSGRQRLWTTAESRGSWLLQEREEKKLE